MITLYTSQTSNGRKISVMLEEVELDYRIVPVNLQAGEQFRSEFIAVSPNNKIPAIIDDEAEGGPLSLFESAAILYYLATKTGRLLSPNLHERMTALAWLSWQVSGMGPIQFQYGFFALRAPARLTLAVDHFGAELDRLFDVLERRLRQVPFLGGNEYSIADISAYPQVLAASTYFKEVWPDLIDRRGHVLRWMADVGERPAVQRGLAKP